MFISCNCVILCPKTLVCWYIIHRIIKNFAIFFQTTIIALFKYSIIGDFAAEIQLVWGFVVAAAFFAKTQHFRTLKHLFLKTRPLLPCFLCLSQHQGAEKNSKWISSKTIGTVRWLQLFPLCCHFRFHRLAHWRIRVRQWLTLYVQPVLYWVQFRKNLCWLDSVSKFLKQFTVDRSIYLFVTQECCYSMLVRNRRSY